VSDLKIRPQDRPPSVMRQVADHLARLIASGALAPGERLPGETVLAHRLGVSRPTVHEALQELKDHGLLEIRPRSGTYVREPEPGEAGHLLEGLLRLERRDLWEVLEIRRILDPETAALAARRRTSEDLVELAAIVKPLRDLPGGRLMRRKGAPRTYGRFFARLARATQNRLVTRLTEAVAGMLRDALAYSHFRLTGRPEAVAEIRNHLLEIFDAVERRDDPEARRATAAHVEFVERTLRDIEAAASS
jgi:GntR family transcriptional repressor for pyruvate dehydrogenase complex